jgi:hypothetical protein
MPTADVRRSDRRSAFRARRRRKRRVGFALIALVISTVAVGAAWADSDVLSTRHDNAMHRRAVGRVPPKAVKSKPRGPLGGALLIADRGNDRMLLVSPEHKILWRFPNARDLRRGVHLNFNDDGFVASGGSAIVANEEEAHTIVSINIRTHRLLHLFGRPGLRGGGASLLNTPDDAYPLPNGDVVVADAYNCRVIWIRAHRIVRQLGESGACVHDPPRTFGAVNGDTPLRDGGILISETAGWVDEIGPRGRLRWSVRAPVGYPSDPQMLPGARILLADYSNPGKVVIMNRFGRVLWRYRRLTGPGALNHPSLALPLPDGNIAVNDDYRDRVVVIDPRANRIVWQYGATDVASRRRGFLNTPDGLDFVPLDARGLPQWELVRHPG